MKPASFPADNAGVNHDANVDADSNGRAGRSTTRSSNINTIQTPALRLPPAVESAPNQSSNNNGIARSREPVTQARIPPSANSLLDAKLALSAATTTAAAAAPDVSDASTTLTANVEPSARDDDPTVLFQPKMIVSSTGDSITPGTSVPINDSNSTNNNITNAASLRGTAGTAPATMASAAVIVRPGATSVPGINRASSSDESQAFPTLATAHAVNGFYRNSNYAADNERARFREHIRSTLAAQAPQAEPVVYPTSRPTTAVQDNMEEDAAATQESHQKKFYIYAAVAAVGVTILMVVVATAVVLGTQQPTESFAFNATVQTTITPSVAPLSNVVVLPDGRRAFTQTQDLYDAVDDYDSAIQANETAKGSLVTIQYGYPMGTWDVSRLTDFSRVFCVNREQTLEADVRLSALRTMDIPSLSGWNVSRATTMHGMFAGAVNWLADDDGLMDWDVGRVTDFSFMFGYAEAWTGHSIVLWNTSSAALMSSMFVKATAFSADLSRWDVTRVTSMSHMFREARTFTGSDGMSRWNTGQVRSMSFMFYNAQAFTGAVSNWDTSNVGTMESMFMGAIAFNDNLSRWSVGKVTNMNSLFLGAFAFEGNRLETWDTSRVTDMKSILRHADNFNGDISTWNVSLVSTFYQAFEFCPLNADLSQWDTRQATNMMQMFANAKAFNSTLATWNVARVTNMVEMLYEADAFNSDLSSWNVSSLRDATRMFQDLDVYNRSLCEWRRRLPVGAAVTDMFLGTACTNKSDPYLSSTAAWSGPFCDPCADSETT